MNWKNVFIGAITFVLIGCGAGVGVKNDGTVVNDVKSVQLDNSLETTGNRNLSVKMYIDSDTNASDVPVSYYLISNQEKNVSTTVNGEGKDVNTTTISEPLYQYNIGSRSINLQRAQMVKDVNITLSSDIPAGKYKVVAYIDPRNSKNIVLKGKAPIIVGEQNIEVKPSVADVELLSAKLDDDVLLLDDSNTDSMLSATLTAKSHVGEVDNLSVKACVKLDNTCIPLPLYDGNGDGNVSYLRPINNLDETMTHISLALQIPKDLKKEWFHSLDSNIHDATIKVTLVSHINNEPLQNNVRTMHLSLYKNDTAMKRSLSRSSTNKVLKQFSKGFTADKMDSRFGVKLSANALAYFGTLKSDAGAHGDITVRVMGHDISMLNAGADAFVQYDSFEDTGYKVSVKIFNKNVFLKEDNVANMAQYKKVETAKLTESEKALPKKEQDEILKERQIKNNASPTEKPLLSYEKNFTVDKLISKKQTIMVSIVPVVVEAGAGGSLGLNNSIGLQGILSLHAQTGPVASIDGFASGGVGVAGFSAGLQASFTFVSNNFHGDTGFDFVFSGNEDSLRLKGILSEKVVNTFKGPNGSVDLYAEYPTDKICHKSTRYCNKWHTDWHGVHCVGHHTKHWNVICGVEKHRPTKNIFKWDSGLSKDITLLNESKTLTDNKIY